MHPIRTLVHDFSWIHTTLGLIGNLAFLVGSVLFLYQDPWQRIGTWLFIIGAAGMLIGSIGNAFVMAEQKRNQS